MAKARLHVARIAFASALLLACSANGSAGTVFQEDWEGGLAGWTTSGSGLAQDCARGWTGCSLRLRPASTSSTISATRAVALDVVGATSVSFYFQGGKTSSDTDLSFTLGLTNGGSVSIQMTEVASPNTGLNLYSAGHGSTGIFARWTSANTWYRVVLVLDASANTVKAELRDASGALIGASGTLGIPAAADRITSVQVSCVAWSSFGTDTFYVDALRVVTADDVPRALAATRGPGAGEISLTWQAPLVPDGTVTAYKVRRADTSGGAATLVGTTDGATLAFKDTGLPNGATRYYTVTAVANTESAASNEAAGTTPGVPGAPVAPIGSRGTARGQTNVAWSPPADDGGLPVAGYRLHRSTAATGTYALVATTNASTRTFTDSGLADGSTYWYKVQATNEAGAGALSAAGSATTPGVPGAPASPSAVRGPARGQIVVAWSPPTSDGGLPVTGYRVQRATSSSGTYAVVGTTDAATRAFTDSGLADGTAYWYKVQATNDAGSGTLSGAVSAVTPGVPGAPASPTAARGSARGEVVVGWSPPTSDGGLPVTGYRVQRATSSTGVYAIVATVDAALRTWTDSGLADATTYYYKVQASNEAGHGTLSAAVAGRTPGPPGAPASPATARGPARGEVTVSWAPPADDGGLAVTGYRVLRATSLTGAYADIGGTDATTRTYVDAGLGDGATLYYKVRAANVAGEGALTSGVAGTTPGVPAAPRTPAAASGPGKGEVTVSWSAPASDGGLPLTGYVVSRGAASTGPFAPVGAVDAATLAFRDGGLADGERAYYVVAASNEIGTGAATTAVSATAPTPPTAARSLVATRGPGRGEIALAWTAPTSTGGTAVDYVVERAPGGTSDFAPVGATAALTYVDGGLPDSTAFAYRVVARNAIGTAPPTTAVSASTPTVPSAPTSPAVAPTGRAALTVTWNVPMDTGGLPVTGFAVYRATSASGPFDPAGSAAGDARAWTDTGLLDSTTYHYRVAAVNAAGEGAWTSSVAARTASVPSEPLALDAQPGSARGSIVVSWFAPADTSGLAVTFDVFVADSPEGPFVRIGGGPDTVFFHEGLPDDTSRWYRVTATNAVGEGPAAGPVSARTFRLPGAPVGVEASPRMGLPAIAVGWQPPEDLGARVLLGYQVYRSVDGGAFVPRAFVTGTTFTDSSVSLFATYTYRVAAVNVVGEGPVSAADCSRPSPFPDDACGLPV